MTGIDYIKRPAPTKGSISPSETDSAKVDLTKISLTKASPGISLTKQTGRLRVNLNWDARPPAPAKRGMLARLAPPQRGIDLDLGCLYELNDGRKGVVQALGNSFGSLDKAP
jgi:tellurite resistance protein TerA